MNTMLAARYLGPDRIEAKKIFLPEIGEDEALIEVEACGFCGSDINIVAGTHPRAIAPLTLGHELSGRIVQIRTSGNGFKIGDRITTYPLITCGRCYACTHGMAHVCRQLRLFGFDVDGGMAEFVKLPVSSLLKLPAGMSAQTGALIEPLAVAVHGVSRTNLQNARIVVVMGAGPIGLLTALVARTKGIENIFVSDVLQSRRKLAESLGFKAVAAGEELRQFVMNASDQNGADVLFECAGHPSSAREMTSLVRSRAVIVNLGVFKEPVKIDMQAVNFKEITLLGSRVYQRSDFQDAIDLAMRLPLEKIVTHSYALNHVTDAFKQFRSGDVCKVMVLPGQEMS
ncbi:MAG TPA: alcohol dehydrogenase catalytic domain-containing protein [Edaphobacter sp.]|jgi:(R,R)-butanediol dehydrogenase/meso-butanediol dehydrogenase/diacetyl reductase|nr:alcohol dehydrogenase catalytic domain-containing protein [Edaphobacter sp.]